MMQNSPVIPKGTGKIGAYLSHTKLVNLLAALIVFLSATQLGLHFWPHSSLVYGIRIDYLSPTLYFLDLLIIVFLFLKKSFLFPGKTNWFGVVLPIFLTNLLYSVNPLASLVWCLHISLYILFVLLLDKRYILQIILIAMLFQVGFGMLQTYLGHSVGGLMYYLGERTVSVGSPGIALGSFKGQVELRAYGTFSHPNIMAGWLVIASLILIQINQSTKLFLKKYLLNFGVLLCTIGIVVTQSRAAAISLFGFMIPFYLLKNLRTRIIYLAFLVLISFTNLSIIRPVRSDLSSRERFSLQMMSLKIISKYPIFGTGTNASISTYPTTNQELRLLQPDHNSLTLLVSWVGIFGLVALIQLYNYQKYGKVIKDLLPLLPLVIFDHYLLTSPQGLFILIIYIRVLVIAQYSPSA